MKFAIWLIEWLQRPLSTRSYWIWGRLRLLGVLRIDFPFTWPGLRVTWIRFIPGAFLQFILDILKSLPQLIIHFQPTSTCRYNVDVSVASQATMDGGVSLSPRMLLHRSLGMRLGWVPVLCHCWLLKRETKPSGNLGETLETKPTLPVVGVSWTQPTAAGRLSETIRGLLKNLRTDQSMHLSSTNRGCYRLFCCLPKWIKLTSCWSFEGFRIDRGVSIDISAWSLEVGRYRMREC